jgi:hypothetical protein
MAFVTDSAAKEKQSKEQVKANVKAKLKDQIKEVDQDTLKKVPKGKEKAVARAAARLSEKDRLDDSSSDGEKEVSTSSASSTFAKKEPKPDGEKEVSTSSASSTFAKKEPKPDLDGAAKRLWQGGIITVNRKALSKDIRTDYHVTDKDMGDIQSKLTALRQASPSTKKTTTLDMRIPANRPTTGGMQEGDAMVIGAQNGWEIVDETFTCTDRSHTPKGRLFTNNAGAYYGADNSGHVGWGFKVWTSDGYKNLKYQGNFVWDGDKWKHIARSDAGKDVAKS